MTKDQIVKAAEQLAQAWRANQTIEPFSGDLVPKNRETAVAIQDELAKQIDQDVVGWKVGGEIVGRVFEPNLFRSPAVLPANSYRRSLLEIELGFQILADLPPRQDTYSADEVAERAVLVPTFELITPLFSENINPLKPGGYLPTEPEWLLAYAANAFCGGVVVGNPIDNWKDQPLRDLPIDVQIKNGSKVPVVPLGARTEPLEVLVWLANGLSQRGIGLKPGQVVTLGGRVGPEPNVAAMPISDLGGTVVVTYGQLGQLEVGLSDS